VEYTKKFDVNPLSFYLKENEHRAFINPSFKMDSIDNESVNGLLSGRYTLKELETLFDVFCTPSTSSSSNHNKPEAHSGDAGCDPIDTIKLVPTLALQDSFELDSPKFTMEEMGIFSLAPQLSFDIDPENVLDPFQSFEDTHSPELISVLRDFQARFVNLKTKWSQTFLEVDTSHSIIVKDLKTIRDRLSTFKRKIVFYLILARQTNYPLRRD
jgi:hypothetical protein